VFWGCRASHLGQGTAVSAGSVGGNCGGSHGHLRLVTWLSECSLLSHSYIQVRVLPAALPPVPQPVCTYRELRFASIRLPGCPPGVDPMVSFPVALSCHCGPCRLSSSDCGGPRAQPLTCDLPHLPGLLFL
jgi:hypothetical protein